MKKWSIIKKIIILFFCFIIAIPILRFSAKEIYKFNSVTEIIHHDDWTNLTNSSLGRYNVIQYIRDNTPENSLFLVFRQSDFAYYAQRKFIRHVDPRLLDLYKLDDKNKAYDFLQNMGIEYIYIPSYMPPTYYNTQIYRIVADPQLCELVKDVDGVRLFKLHETRGDVSIIPLNAEGTGFPFKENAGDRGSLGWSVYNDSEEYEASNWLLENDEVGQPVLTVRSYGTKTMIYSGRGLLKSPPSNSFYESRLEPKTTFRLSASVKGKGFLKVFLVDYSDNDEKKRYGYFINLLKYLIPIKAKERGWCMLWNSVLTKDYKLIENQFTLREDAHECRIIFVLNGRGQLSLRKVTVEEIHNNYNADACDQKKTETVSWETNQRVESNEPVIYESPISLSDQLPLGLSSGSEDGRSPIYLDQPDGKECWYYTGEGSALIPPSFFSDNSSFQIDRHGSHSFRISAFVKGRGHFDLFIRYYDENGRRKLLHIGRYFLQNDYKVLKKIVNLPERIKEFRVAFRLSEINNLKLIAKKLQKKIGRLYGINRVWETYNEPSTLYIDNLTVEPVACTP